MGEDKVDVLLRVSETNLSRAEKRYAESEYDSAVFHASLAVENAANAMILVYGGDEAKDHRAISGLSAVIRRIQPELLRDNSFNVAMEMGREIQREVVYTRYPILVGGEWVTPMEYYTMEKSRGIIEKATLVVNGIRRALDKKSA
jgi:HEPN domain-containing protein